MFNLDVDDADAKKTMILQLHKLLRPFVLRRLKVDVEKTLPPKTETILFAQLTSMQKDVYRNLLLRDASLLGAGEGGATSSRAALSNIAMQLRKCCNHPYVRRVDILQAHRGNAAAGTWIFRGAAVTQRFGRDRRAPQVPLPRRRGPDAPAAGRARHRDVRQDASVR